MKTIVYHLGLDIVVDSQATYEEVMEAVGERVQAMMKELANMDADAAFPVAKNLLDFSQRPV